ncbi:hypothetical protein BKA64DRAFT_28808 [Cadophora sp. MPI-SDFR-AT-0126]|nr:hypothetical protein BKA64DRAFT_28808 [Leotiomycetes sp. MPI-SDFR-AT-0126]
MSPSKYKRKQHNPIHGWLDKMFGGDWLDQDEREDRKWAALKDKAERECQEVIFLRGGIHLVPRRQYDAQGVPVTPGSQPRQPMSAHSNIGSEAYSFAGQVSARPSEAGSTQSHAEAIAQSRQLQNTYVNSGLLPNNPMTYSEGSRLSQARHNSSMTSVSRPALTNQPSSFYQPNTRQSRFPAASSQYPGGPGSSGSSQRNNGRNNRSPPRPQMRNTHSGGEVSGITESPSSQSILPGQQTFLNLQASSQTINRENSHQLAPSRYQSCATSSWPSLNESQSAPSVSIPHRFEHQSKRPSNLRSQTQPTSSSPADLRAEAWDDVYSIAPTVWSMSIATSQAQVGNMQRTYLEGMVPKTPSELRAELEGK